ncbi:MAG: S-layer family protein, partial [Pleurocapsa sp. MO_226.B13]|nr:S-layer family protein [Pleurocapsa sp. MO_226.B13]
GGSIIIDPRTLTIRDGATISVDSQGTGIGGDIELSAGFLTLDNGTISAETRSNTGGDIILNLQDLLLLSNDSKISTTAGNQEFGGNGGNITINTPFIVAFPDENSDITANAFEGSGGQINITAQGIFGIEEREAIQENQTNDIDASSEFGLAGVVEINQPDVDPSQGLVELPETVVDPNALVAQNPCKRGSESEFVITGRGGLPPSLSEDLSSEATQVGLVEPAPMVAREQGNREAGEQISSSLSVPTTIIPAQGWVFNERGEIVLVAYNPTVTGSQRLKENSTGCPTSGKN